MSNMSSSVPDDSAAAVASGNDDDEANSDKIAIYVKNRNIIKRMMKSLETTTEKHGKELISLQKYVDSQARKAQRLQLQQTERIKLWDRYRDIAGWLRLKNDLYEREMKMIQELIESRKESKP